MSESPRKTPIDNIMPFIEESQISTPKECEERIERIRVKNRRKLYLDRNPSYFTSPDLELSDPLLYDRCIRRFQSTAEREADGRSKGYSGVLEADLYRSEAKLEALKGTNTESGGEPTKSLSSSSLPFVSYSRGQNGEVLPEDPDEIPESKEDGLERWRFAMTLKFLNGEDEDFDYNEIDKNGEWDLIERKEEEDRWFDEEEPEWDGKDFEEVKNSETGIQDY